MPEDKEQDLEKPRQGVVSVEVTVTYEDGFSSTIKSPRMIGYEPTSMAIVAPGSEKTMVKKMNVGAMKQTMGILEGVLEDVRKTIPSDEEIAEERRKIAELQAAKMRKAGGPDFANPGQIIHPK